MTLRGVAKNAAKEPSSAASQTTPGYDSSRVSSSRLSEIAKGCTFKQGLEMDSLGMIAQQKDAEAVLATLSSSVADLLIISTLALRGIAMAPLPFSVLATELGAAVVFWLILDGIKIPVFARLHIA